MSSGESAFSKLALIDYLKIVSLDRITDYGVSKIARACTRLRYIDLASDSLLTDMSVFELASNCPKLKRIGLVKVRRSSRKQETEIKC